MGFFILELSSVWQSTWLISSLSWVQILQFQLLSYSTVGNKFKDVKIIKYISKNEIEKLLSEGVIRNTKRGYVDYRGEHIGYYKTCGGKRYIEDKYVK